MQSGRAVDSHDTHPSIQSSAHRSIRSDQPRPEQIPDGAPFVAGRRQFLWNKFITGADVFTWRPVAKPEEKTPLPSPLYNTHTPYVARHSHASTLQLITYCPQSISFAIQNCPGLKLSLLCCQADFSQNQTTVDCVASSWTGRHPKSTKVRHTATSIQAWPEAASHGRIDAAMPCARLTGLLSPLYTDPFVEHRIIEEY